MTAEITPLQAAGNSTSEEEQRLCQDVRERTEVTGIADAN